MWLLVGRVRLALMMVVMVVLLRLPASRVGVWAVQCVWCVLRLQANVGCAHGSRNGWVVAAGEFGNSLMLVARGWCSCIVMRRHNAEVGR